MPSNFLRKKSIFQMALLTNFQTFHKFEDAFVQLLFKSSRPANGTVKLSTKVPSLAVSTYLYTFDF